MHVVQVVEVSVEELAKVRADGSLLLDVCLHRVDVARACPQVVEDRRHLLHLLSQEAVESHARLEEADVALAEADLPADLAGQLRKMLVVGPQAELLLTCDEFRVLLST